MVKQRPVGLDQRDTLLRAIQFEPQLTDDKRHARAPILASIRELLPEGLELTPLELATPPPGEDLRDAHAQLSHRLLIEIEGVGG